MKIAIIGGGLGGMTLALALHDAGIDDVEVYESSSAIKEVGVGINVQPHAVRELTVALMLASPQSRIVSVLIWNFWETGDIGMTAATGVLLILFIASILTVGRLVSVKVFKAD